MVDFCSEPEDVEGLCQESILIWRHLRMGFIEKLRDPDNDVPERFHLSDGYFDNLPDHGPLPSLPALQLPPFSGHTDIETDIHQPAPTGPASDMNGD